MEFKKKKEKFYEIDKIIEKESLYNIIYGERSNGKSFAVKKWCLERAYKEGELFALIFRYSSDKATNKNIENYFLDTPIIEITGKKYNSVFVRAGAIYLCSEEEEESGKIKKIKGPQVGYIAYLDSEEKYKSLPFEGCVNIIFEEFISRRAYLVDETTKLQSIISTIFRLRLNYQICRVFLIGNLISQVNPYTREWNLNKLTNQKEGTIDEYVVITETGKIKIACERCQASKMQGGIAINSKGQAMERGTWEVEEVPLFNKKNINNFEVLYTFVYTYMGFYFLCKFLREKNSMNMFIFIEKKTTEIKEGTRVIGDVYNSSILYTTDFKPLVPREGIIFDLIKQGKIMFSDFLTGTNFYTCYNTMKKIK